MPSPTSPRLLYRRLSGADVDTFHALTVDPHVRRYLFDGEVMPRAWAVEAVQISEAAEPGGGLWLLEEKERRGQPIGFAGFWVFEEIGPEPQLLYALLEAHTGRGYAGEAAEALISFARTHGGLGTIVSAVDAPNLASLRVLERLGFVRVGELPGAFGRTVKLELPAGRAPLELRTGRLLLRPFRDADLEPFARLNADPRVMEHFPAPLGREESDALAARIRARHQADGYGLWAVEVPGVAPFIGFTGLARPSFEAAFTPCLEVGWRLAAEHWGCGYATEAARAAVAAAFVHLGAPEIVSFTSTGNLRSRQVMERLGMRRDEAGDFEHPRLPEGHPLRRHVLYRLERAVWASSRAPAR